MEQDLELIVNGNGSPERECSGRASEKGEHCVRVYRHLAL